MLACMRTAAVYGIEAYAESRSRSTCRSACPASPWWDCPTPASVRAATGFAARSAIQGSSFLAHRITGPTCRRRTSRKEGASFDLPIALGVLAASGVLVRRDVDDLLLVGALSLDGAIQPTRGVLPVACGGPRATAMAACCCRKTTSARRRPCRAWIWYGVRDLPEAVRALDDPRSFDRPLRVAIEGGPPAAAVPDFADVHGQLLARRALEIAAAGGHNLLLVGTPGVGKTMLARRLAGILPPLSQEKRSRSPLYSRAGLLPAGEVC